MRCQGLAQRSIDWLDRAAKQFWDHTQGEITQESLTQYRNFILTEYESRDSHSKTLGFSTAFLNHLSKLHMNPKYAAFSVYIELPKKRLIRKCVTSRIITIDDITNILKEIDNSENNGEINSDRANYYRAFILTGAYTGQRIEATMSKLTVGEVRQALKSDKPCIQIPSEKDKIRMEHYVPLHPVVIDALKVIIGDRPDDDQLFAYFSTRIWFTRKKYPLKRCDHHFVLGDLRKFAEQHGDAICWNDSNRSYILTHGVSGVQWSHYKSPLPEYVYDVYMQAWKDVIL